MKLFYPLIALAGFLSGCAAQTTTATPQAASSKASALSVVLSGAPRADGEKISFPYAETFEEHPLDRTPFGWVDRGDAKSTSKVVDAGTVTAKSGSAVLHLLDNSTEDSAELMTVVGEITKGSIQFSFYDDSDNPADNYVTLGAGKNADGRVVDVQFSASGKIRYRDQSGKLQSIGRYTLDQWHDVAILVDMSKERYFLFLDGAQVQELPTVQAEAPTHLIFKAGSKSKSGHSVYLDNVQVEHLR